MPDPGLPPADRRSASLAGKAERRLLRRCGAMLLLAAWTTVVSAQSFPAFDEHVAELTANNPKAVAAEATRQIDQGASLPPVRQLAAWRNLAVVSEELGDSEVARTAVAAGNSLAQRLGNRSAECLFRSLAASQRFSSSLAPAAIDGFADPLAFAQENSLPHCLAYTYWLKGQAYATLDRAGDALDYLLKAHTLFESMQDRISSASVLSTMVSVYRLESVDPEATRKAKEHADRALALIDEKRYPNLASTIHHDLAVAFLDGRDWRHARPHIDTALQLSRMLDDRTGTAYSLRLLARAELGEHHFREAIAAADAALPVFIEGKLPDLELYTRLSRAGALAGLHREREALTELDRSRALAGDLKSAKYRQQFHRMASEVYAQLHDFQNAYLEAVRLNEAQQDYAREANVNKASALQAQFEVQQRETENRLLRAEKRADRASNAALGLVVGLCAVLIVGLVLYLFEQNRQKRRIATLATRDELTGLHNRRHILDCARAALKKPAPPGTACALALIDIDHFKRINDSFGHHVGDDALVAFARISRALLAPGWEMGRFGGEEFMLVMPAVGADALPAFFEGLREALRSETARSMPQVGQLTFSMGYAFVRDESDLEDAIVRADKALYEAKRSGRDRWCPETLAA